MEALSRVESSLLPWRTWAGEEVGSGERAPAELGWARRARPGGDPKGLNGRGESGRLEPARSRGGSCSGVEGYG